MCTGKVYRITENQKTITPENINITSASILTKPSNGKKSIIVTVTVAAEMF